MDLGLDVVDRVAGLNLKGDGLSCEGLHENLHACGCRMLVVERARPCGKDGSYMVRGSGRLTTQRLTEAGHKQPYLNPANCRTRTISARERTYLLQPADCQHIPGMRY